MKGRIGAKRQRCDETVPRFFFPPAVEAAGRSGEIQRALTKWFAANGRVLPWRVPGKRDPYGIWVSEVMAQQTQLATVIPYWNKWMGRFPTATALAQASSEDVRAAWSGLGFYRRADMLHRGAQQIATDHNGIVPSTVDGLLTIAGVGPYTAHAIASICFGTPRICVDGNVIRVLSRLAGFRDVDPKDAKTIKELGEFANRPPLPADDSVPVLLSGCAKPGDFNEGLMELGASLCAANSPPKCDECPLRTWCAAYTLKREGAIDDIEGCIPMRGKRLEKRTETHSAVVVVVGASLDDSKAKVLCTVNPEGKLLSQMLAVPSVVEAAEGPRTTFSAAIPCGSYKHVFSHIAMSVNVYSVLVKSTKPTLAQALSALDAVDASSGVKMHRDKAQLIPIASFLDESCTEFAITSLARKAVALALKRNKREKADKK